MHSLKEINKHVAIVQVCCPGSAWDATFIMSAYPSPTMVAVFYVSDETCRITCRSRMLASIRFTLNYAVGFQ